MSMITASCLGVIAVSRPLYTPSRERSPTSCHGIQDQPSSSAELLLEEAPKAGSSLRGARLAP
jgi:hypothetical protein